MRFIPSSWLWDQVNRNKFRSRVVSNRNGLYEGLEPRHLLADVSGHITQDTTWDATDTIQIVGDVTVDPGVTLTVEPRTQISTADGGHQLIFNGSALVAELAEFIGENNSLVFDAGSTVDMRVSKFSGVGIQFLADSSGTLNNNNFNSGMLRDLSYQILAEGNRFYSPEPLHLNPKVAGNWSFNSYSPDTKLWASGLVDQTDDASMWNAAGNVDWKIVEDLTVATDATLTVYGDLDIETISPDYDITVEGTFHAKDFTTFTGNTEINVNDGGTLYLTQSTVHGDQIDFRAGSNGVVSLSTIDLSTDEGGRARVLFNSESNARIRYSSVLNDTVFEAYGDSTINIPMTDNSWGSGLTIEEIALRVIDQSDLPTKPLVEFDADGNHTPWTGGSLGDNVFVVHITNDLITVTINGETTEIEHLPVISMWGNQGFDTLELVVDSDDVQISVDPRGSRPNLRDQINLQNWYLNIDFENFESVVAVSNGERTKVTLADSNQDDLFIIRENRVELTVSDSFDFQMDGVDESGIVAADAGVDEVRIITTPIAEIFDYREFVWSPLVLRAENGSYRHEVDRKFEIVRVIGAENEEGAIDVANFQVFRPDQTLFYNNDVAMILTDGVEQTISGFDQINGFPDDRVFSDASLNAILWGTEGEDALEFNGTQKTAKLTNSDGTEISINNFTKATFRGAGGNDVVEGIASELDDSLYSTVGASYLSNADVGFYGLFFDFERMFLRAGRGVDSAFIRGSEETAGRFFGGATYGRWISGDVDLQAIGFESTVGRAGADGGEAFFNDSEGDDRVVLMPEFASIKIPVGDSGDVNQVRAVGFQSNLARSTAGLDELTLLDSAQDDTVILAPEFSSVAGENFELYGSGFSSTFAIASEGNDLATFRDTEGNDTFIGRPTSGLMVGAAYQNFAIGFDRYFARSTGGEDIARLFDSELNDELFINAESVTLKSKETDAYRLSVVGFANTVAFSVGGEDDAYLTDSEDDDFLRGEGVEIWMFNSSMYWSMSGFEYVLAGSINGGNDSVSTGELNVVLETYGNWNS